LIDADIDAVLKTGCVSESVHHNAWSIRVLLYVTRGLRVGDGGPCVAYRS
jgi:hypothetical protein